MVCQRLFCHITKGHKLKMKKNREIKFRVSEDDFCRIEEAAKKSGETISAYVRSRMREDLTEGWIKKTVVQQALSNIAKKLDKYEEKNMRIVQSIRKEVEMLWKKI